MSVVSEAARIAQLKVDLLVTIQEAQVLEYSLKKRDDELAELKEDMSIMRRRAEENMETTLSMKRAEHDREMALDKKAHSDLAEQIATSYVEKELKALGAFEALEAFRAKRAERRREVDKIFRCDRYADDGARLHRATKRRQNFEDEEAYYEERKKQRVEELHQKWEQDWNEVVEQNKECEESIIRQKDDLAREEDNLRRRTAAIANHSLAQELKAADKKATRKLWAPYMQKLKATEAHEEVDMPKFDDAQEEEEEEEDDGDRHYPLNWEEDRAEQFGIFIIPPPRIEQEIIQLD